jgi:hypothetical protein
MRGCGERSAGKLSKVQSFPTLRNQPVAHGRNRTLQSRFDITLSVI